MVNFYDHSTQMVSWIDILRAHQINRSAFYLHNESTINDITTANLARKINEYDDISRQADISVRCVLAGYCSSSLLSNLGSLEKLQSSALAQQKTLETRFAHVWTEEQLAHRVILLVFVCYGIYLMAVMIADKEQF